MSYRVLVIPEDFRHDQHILLPLVQAIMDKAGKPNANVRICNDPKLGGIDQALRRDKILNIVRRYGMVDLFLLCVDRDGDQDRRARLDDIERHVAENAGKRLLAENAWQELEVWILAGMTDFPADWSWEAMRSEVSFKERYFLPYVTQRGFARLPDEGRKTLGMEAKRRYARVRSMCKEDVQSLEQRIVRPWMPIPFTPP